MEAVPFLSLRTQYLEEQFCLKKNSIQPYNGFSPNKFVKKQTDNSYNVLKDMYNGNCNIFSIYPATPSREDHVQLSAPRKV